jgi:hypothetical protein
MEYGKELFIEDDILSKLAEHSKKTVMHVKAVGAIECAKCGDKEKEDSIWDFYFDKCDLGVLNLLMQFKEVYCYFNTPEQAIHAYEEWFPNKNQLLEGEEHLYVKVSFVSPDGSVIGTNE